MSKDICIFKRMEKKYQLSRAQKDRLLNKVGAYLIPDIHGESTICSLYLDTPDYLLIRNSIDANVYKEKLRLRSYGTPTSESQVFLERKKKYKGVVYKRRVAMSLEQAEAYLDSGKKPVDSQIMSEIDYAMKFYNHPRPAMFIAYEREAFYAKDYPELRLTFDCSVRYRDTDLLMDTGTDGKKIISDNAVLLEIKTDGSMPMWLAHALDECEIHPVSFSKYGTAYQDVLNNHYQNTCKGENKYVCNL